MCLINSYFYKMGIHFSRQIGGETKETVTDFIFLGSKIIAVDDCSHEIKMLALWKKGYDQF